MTALRSVVVFALIVVPACGDAPEPDPPDEYVGREACVACHAAESSKWRGSHHDLAMDVATAETVVGDFDGATLAWYGVTSTFSKRDGKFVVRTEGDDGKLHDYEVAYVFGATPLQQYLVEFPGGRYQTLPLCWDSRPAAAGGQRWFHIYPDEHIAPGDSLFWTGPAQNWNSMCADCHSTRLRKGYDLETDTYETTWSEIDVSCEACHGPGREHLAWAEGYQANPPDPLDEDPDDPMGLQVDLSRHGLPAWEIDMETGTAKRVRKPGDEVEVEACARCHSRRSPIRTDYVHGRPLLDTHRLSGLDEALYFSDGQIKDEVYVTGSFLQSRMYAAGVSCSDCHDPHSLQLKSDGNSLCTRCHIDAGYDTPDHHHHEPGGSGAACVECHMPERTYMVVDPRRDHSIRIPRPDLTRKIGSPNACNGCHTDESVAWAEQHVNEWYGTDREPHFGEALHAGRAGAAGSAVALAALVEDAEQPGIARATALSLLRGMSSPTGLDAISTGLTAADPMVRAAAANALRGYPVQARSAVRALLEDPVSLVRVEAARALAAVPRRALDPADVAAFDEAFDELVRAELANAERATAHLNLGAAYSDRGANAEAERAYRTALRLAPDFFPVYANLADLYRVQRRDAEAEQLLRDALAEYPDEALLQHTLGLVLVRLRKNHEAVGALRKAAEREPGIARYAYVYAIALRSTGDTAGSLAALEDAHARHPRDRRVLYALATTLGESGDLRRAIEYATKLVALAAGEPGARDLLEALRARQNR